MTFRMYNSTQKYDFLSTAVLDASVVNTGTLGVVNINTENVLLNNTVSLTANSAGADYNLIFPEDIPLVSQKLGVETVSGENITLQWQASSSGEDIPNFIIVYKGVPSAGSSYNSLYDAITYINTQTPSSTNRWTINIYPGIYTETQTVVIPSWVTVMGNFSLSTVIKTSGSGHIIQMGNRTDIYFVTIQGPTEDGKAGIFLDDTGIGTFIGNCRFVGCDYGVIVRPAVDKICYCYFRGCLFNSNSTNQLLIDSSASGSKCQVFAWDNIYYAESSGLIIDTYGPLVYCTGAETTFREYSADYERDFDNVIGIGIEATLGAFVIMNGAVWNWLATAIFGEAGGSAPNIILNAPEFFECTENILIEHTGTTGFLSGVTEFSKLSVPLEAPWFVAGNDKQVITVGDTQAENFTTINDAISYINSLATPPSTTNKFIILVSPGNFTTATTLIIPDFVDLHGSGFPSTSLTITTINTDLIYAGYDSDIAYISLYGFGTNTGATNLFTPNNSIAFGVKYRGTSPYIVDDNVLSSTYTSIGYMEQVVLANHYYMIGVETPSAKANILQFTDIRFLGYINTNTCIHIDALASSVATAVGINGARYSPTYVNGFPGAFTYFCRITGASGVVNSNIFNNINTRSGGTNTGLASGIPLKFGTAYSISQGELNLRNSLVKQYDTGIYVPDGAANPQPSIVTTGLTIQLVNTSINIENPAITGTIQGVMDKSSLTIASPSMAILITDDTGEGTVVGGSLFQSATSAITPVTNEPSNITPQINQVATVGFLTGGVLTSADSGGWKAYITSGTGYTMKGVFPNDQLTYTEFDAQNIALTANSLNYIFVNNSGIIGNATSEPDDEQNINLGIVVSGASGIPIYIEESLYNIKHLPHEIDKAFVRALGGIVVSGMIASSNGSRQVIITQGEYYLGSNNYIFPEVVAGTAFDGFYLTSAGSLYNYTLVSGLTQFPDQWNSISLGVGTLTTLGAGEFVKHALYISGDTTNQKVMMVYGEENFATLNDAIAGAIPSKPSFLVESVILIGGVIVTNPAAVSQVIDLRPIFITRLGTVTSTSNHSALSNLGADDHPQYLLVSGTRAMTGSLNMGNQNVTTAGTYNGVTVQTHASRHLPSGDDPLPIAAPVTISALSNSQGIAASFALSDHLHAHGAQTDATLHAVATGLANGFMPSTDKTKLDNATASSTVSTLVLRDGSGVSNFRGIGLNTSAGVTAISLAAPIGTTAYTLTLPSTDGNANEFLQTNGSGTTTWATAVTSVATSGGLTGGTITGTGTISIADTAVTPASYTLASITVDQKGRLTAASNGSAVTSVATGTGLTGGTITSTGTISLANTAVSAGTYDVMTGTVDAQGRLTSASTGNLTGDVTSVGLATTQVIGKVSLKQLTASQTVTSATLTNITNLSGFSLSASSTYFFKIYILITTSANNDGYLVTTNASGVVSAINYIYNYATSATASTFQNVTSLQGGTVSPTGTNVTPRGVTLEGSVTTSGAVTFDVQFRSESGVQSATANSGSFAYVQRIT